jgi:hypothetical protein
MSLKTRLKDFYKTWMEPPGVRAWRTRHPAPDLQKFWTGTPVSAPPLERAYFDQHELESATITRRDDSRSCGLVTRSARLRVPTVGPGESVQLAVSADAWLPDSRLVCRAGGTSVTHTGLTPGRWLDIRLDAAGATEVEITTDQPLWVSYPRVARRRAKGSSRHVLVMVLDGLSRRALAARHPTDPDRTPTPNLDRFFAKGYVASTGFSSAEWTLPTTGSFFSGLYASRHGLVHPTRTNCHPRDRKLLAEYLQEAGFHTMAMSTGNRLTPAFDGHRGFDRFIYHWPYEGRTAFDYNPAVWIDEIIGHLDVHRHDSTFIYAHFSDTHPAWNVPPLTRAFNLSRRGDSTGHDLDRLEESPLGNDQGLQLLLVRLYDLDRALGGLLDYFERELSDEFIVVMTADHGSPWADFVHLPAGRDKLVLNEFQIGTPFRIRGAGVPSSAKDQLVCPNLDLMPTLLRLAGVQAPPDLDGRDLFAGGEPREHIISESLYKTAYEIAISNDREQWIEKYPMDEATNKLTGPAFYRGGFAVGTTDFRVPQRTDHPEFEQVVQDHIRRVRLIAASA